MNLNKLWLVGTLALAAAAPASAGGAVALGTPLGLTLGARLGEFLPLAGSGLLVVAAASLVVGIRIARRKRSKRA